MSDPREVENFIGIVDKVCQMRNKFDDIAAELEAIAKEAGELGSEIERKNNLDRVGLQLERQNIENM